MKSIHQLMIFLSCLGLGGLTGCKAVVNTMAFHPDRRFAIPVEARPAGVEERVVVASDGVRLQAYFLSQKSSDRLLIYFHGNAGNLDHRLSTLAYIRSQQINVLGVSYRGYGKSQGSPNEAGLYLDGEAALRYAQSELGFEINKIFIFGRSLGTTVAMNTAQGKDLAGLILISPLTSGRAQASATGLAPISFLAGGAFRNIDRAPKITCPTLIVHGTEDRVIPQRMGKEIYDLLPGKKQLVLIESAGHNDISSQYAKQYWAPILKFIKPIK